MKTPCGVCCSTRISVARTHYTFLKKRHGQGAELEARNLDGETLALGQRVASLISNSAPLEPYSRTMHRALRWSYEEDCFL